jgi:hypothetical protein
VSTTVRPVTQTAEVDVKSASIYPTGAPLEEIGSISRIVPVKIKSANATIAVRAGDRTMDFDIPMDQIDDCFKIFRFLMKYICDEFMTIRNHYLLILE